jgi:hypothetical protein
MRTLIRAPARDRRSRRATSLFLSLVVTLPASSEEDTGYGLLYTRKTATFGIVSQRISGEGDVISLVFGITLADQLENTSKTLKKRRELIESQLEAVRDAIDKCRNDSAACAGL